MQTITLTPIVIGAALVVLKLTKPSDAFKVAGVILAICVGVAVLIAAEQGRINVKINTGVHLGLRRPP